MASCQLTNQYVSGAIMEREDFIKSLKNVMILHSIEHINDHHENTYYKPNGDAEALADAVLAGGVSTLELVCNNRCVGDVQVRVREDVEFDQRVVDFYMDTPRAKFLVQKLFYPYA